MKYKVKFLLLLIIISVNLYGKNIDFNTLTKQAIQENKHLLVFFSITGGQFCKKMIEDSFNEIEMDDIEENFIFIPMNISRDDNVVYKDFKGTPKDFAHSFGIHNFPTFYFINKAKKIVFKVNGYRTKEQFDTILKYIRTKSYQTMSLDDYIAELDMEN